MTGSLDSLRVKFGSSWTHEDIMQLGELLCAGISPLHCDDEGDYEVLVSGRPTRSLLEGSSALRHLLIPFSGLPAATSELMREYSGITVHNIHHNASSAAELALGLTIAAARRVVHADRMLRMGDWSPRYNQKDCLLIDGSRSLVLGYGHIGSRVGRFLSAMGSTVRGIRRSAADRETHPEAEIHPPENLRSILPETDILVLCLPLTHETRGIVGDTELGLMHERSVLVNVGRGDLVDQDALYRHLSGGSIGAAGIDVWYRYPGSEGDRKCTMPSVHDLSSLDNIVMTPHIGGAFGAKGLETLRLKHIAESINTLKKSGRMPNIVDIRKGY